MTTNRKPIYSQKAERESSRTRVVSRPNGLWRAEYHTGDRPPEAARNRLNPWAAIGRDTELHIAKRQAGLLE
jgi:hypothetical protein